MSLNQKLSRTSYYNVFRFGELFAVAKQLGVFFSMFFFIVPGVCDAIEEELFDEILSSKGAKPDFFADAMVK